MSLASLSDLPLRSSCLRSFSLAALDFSLHAFTGSSLLRSSFFVILRRVCSAGDVPLARGLRSLIAGDADMPTRSVTTRRQDAHS
eukprot:3672128-Rhodomonas_salina.4